MGVHQYKYLKNFLWGRRGSDLLVWITIVSLTSFNQRIGVTLNMRMYVPFNPTLCSKEVSVSHWPNLQY